MPLYDCDEDALIGRTITAVKLSHLRLRQRSEFHICILKRPKGYGSVVS